MTYLGDFLGQLMAEMTIARVHADVESIRMAELYSGHDLLRHFPVPRVRLPDVQVDLPVVAKADAPGTPKARVYPSAKDVVARFHPKAVERLKTAGVALSTTRVSKLKTRLMMTAKRFEQPAGIPVDVGRLSSELAEQTLGMLTKVESKRFSREAKRTETQELRKVARQSAIELQPEQPRLDVGVTADELRDAGEAVTRIHLRICEEGVEWTSIETDGRTIDRLVPE